jgi:putative tricarboxylic transport membrane protein
LLLGFVLGPLLEANLRRTMLITQGDASIFIERPISLTMLAATVLLLALMIVPSFRKKREEAFQEDEA